MADTALVIDIGTTATKAGLVVDGALGPVASADNAPPQRSDDGSTEQDLTALWQAVVEATRALGSIDPDLIAVTGQMQNLITLDREGQPLHRSILYSDTRAGTQHRAVAAELGPDWERAIGYAPDATTLPAKYRWLTEHRQDIGSRAAHALFGTHSYMVYRLSGVAAVDRTTAGTTGLLDNRSQSWWQPAAEMVVGELPAIVDPQSPVGRLQADAASSLGLSAGIPIFHGPGDAGSATAGTIGAELGRSYVYVGTSGWAGQLVDRFEPLPGSLLIPAATDGHWIRAAPLLAAGSVIEWACRALLGGIALTELDQLVGDTCGAADGVWFVPNLGGDRMGGNLDAAGSLSGLRWSTTVSTVAAAVVEGISHELRPALAAIRNDRSLPLIATGGATRLATLCQSMADVTGCTVDISSGVHSTLQGTAALALGADIGPGSVDDDRREVWEPISARVHHHDKVATARVS